MNTKPKPAASMWTGSMLTGIFGGLALFLGAGEDAAVVLGAILLIASGILGLVAMYRVVASIDWLVDRKYAAIRPRVDR